VKQQRAHQERVPCPKTAQEIVILFAKPLNTLGGKPTETMTARQNAQSAIGLIAIVQVQADSEHPFEQFHRRLNVRHPVFGAPGAETWNGGLVLEAPVSNPDAKRPASWHQRTY